MPADFIRFVLLRFLASARPGAIAQDTLLARANRVLTPPLEAADLMQHLAWLLDRHFAGFVPDPLDPGRLAARQWHLCAAGAALLRP